MQNSNLVLEVWRLHPRGPRIVPADRQLLGEAPPAALRWCGPFTYANQLGWWVYPPLDIDLVYRRPDERGGPDRKYEENPDCRALNMLPGYFEYRAADDGGRDEERVIGEMLRPHHRYRHTTRQHYAFGEVEANVVSLWTGCVFRTPPGWCLHIRGPINLDPGQPFRVQEGVLETDWMQYDIWMNLKFFKYDEWASLRRDQPYPVAQLVPVRRESYDAEWSLRDEVLGGSVASGGEAAEIFDRWNDYNYRKWERNEGRKDPATYHKQRRRSGF